MPNPPPSSQSTAVGTPTPHDRVLESSATSPTPTRSALHISAYPPEDPHYSTHARFDLPDLPPGDPHDETELSQSLEMKQHHVATAGLGVPPSSTATAADSRSTSSHGDRPAPLQLDIEHVPVEDDPRAWSDRKKTYVLVLVAMATLTPMLATSIYNPAFNQLRTDLGATDNQLSLSVSLFILFQGCWPIFWSSIAEVSGRKWLYVISFSCFITGSTVASRANSMNLLIGMRMLQAFGSSAVLSMGAGTLSDMYEKHERGTKMGVYYGVPLLGPSLGPILGGILAGAFDWRATFYLIVALAGVTLAFFLFLPDSWRKERSTLYQAATKRALKRALAAHANEEKKRLKKASKGLASTDPTPGTTVPPTPARLASTVHSGAHTPAIEISSTEKEGIVDGVVAVPMARSASSTTHQLDSVKVDMERKEVSVKTLGEAEAQDVTPVENSRRQWWDLRRARPGSDDLEHERVKLTFADVNPLPAMWEILRVPSNLVILISSGLLFASQYTIPFTAAVTFADPPYNLPPIKIGLVLLAFGGGNVTGSLIGGRYSDYMLRRLKKANGGVGYPEMRLKSTVGAMFFMVPSFLTYAWVCQEKTMIAGPIVALFGAGFFLMVIYTSALAYLVDANPGRSASAVASNSFFRGVFACICSQVALLIRSAIGDGGLYTILSGILVIGCLGFVLVIKKGQKWRKQDWRFFHEARPEGDVESTAAATPNLDTHHKAVKRE